ncbi:hypothetical protein AJ79_03137 [Helicocarpus griseus UAMH5409]|uniref:Uncharacterized protein n=1 Tax=Helicocarpus griseus UAMH5409 TaxID=1447875 RepID=A0A2B7XZF0_9EURO|nr:hypothetical protein AJ79_03137 [Helicocarpus griseus UAMH5409]
MSCTEASDSTQSPCGHSGAQTNIMAARAGIDVVCGVYPFELEGPRDTMPPSPKPEKPEKPQDPKVEEVDCYGRQQFSDHEDVDPDEQNRFIGWAELVLHLKTSKLGESKSNFTRT